MSDETTPAGEFAKATPRPWSPDPNSSPVLVRCRFEVVARIERRNDRATEEADAALIALAVNAFEPMQRHLVNLRRVLDAMHQPADTPRDPMWFAGMLHQARAEVAAGLRAADGATEGQGR